MNATTEGLMAETTDLAVLNWAPDAPRGGKAVLNRALKENTTVPLFFAQTMISSLRDVGYNHTTSALCEHIDNAIEAGATEIRVYFRQSGKKGDYQIDVAVFDNGKGMSPNILKIATSFGGSTSFNNRSGIGRFGMGMKTAALSMSPVLELYSWQERDAYYSMTLDVEAIGKDRSNMVELPEPTFQRDLPDEVAELFTKPMAWPTDRTEQVLFARDAEELREKLGSSGTLVYMPACDRLTYVKSKTLSDHATSEMARVYRRFIAKGVRLYVNNRKVDAFDPTYFMVDARHTKYLEGLGISTHSRLYLSKPIEIKISGAETSPTATAMVKIFRLPIEDWAGLSRKTLKNDLRVFDGQTVTMLRNDREVASRAMPELTTRHSVSYWYRIQIEFPGVLDEAFGVASNKQGVRMKDHVFEAIKSAIGGDITTLNDEIKRYQAQKASEREAAKPAASELRASEVDHYHPKPMDGELTAEEQVQLDANLRGLAAAVKREGETDDQAFDRVKASKYLIDFRHDEYWPFYHVEHKFGRIIVTLNTAHPFYAQLYEPLRQAATKPPADEGETSSQEPQVEDRNSPIVALELLLLSMARAQSVLSARNEEAQKVFEGLRREWSETYRIQLTA
jgi:Histidine kinase-, DNA gyrase B-, and HSP90-like ATPase